MCCNHVSCCLAACSDSSMYPVAVVENYAAERSGLSGLYELHINLISISLHNITSKQIVYTWPLKYIRRYGRTSKNFQFEAGRKCQTGKHLISIQIRISNSYQQVPVKSCHEFSGSVPKPIIIHLHCKIANHVIQTWLSCLLLSVVASKMRKHWC